MEMAAWQEGKDNLKRKWSWNKSVVYHMLKGGPITLFHAFGQFGIKPEEVWEQKRKRLKSTER